jgi:hypothetical protein
MELLPSTYTLGERSIDSISTLKVAMNDVGAISFPDGQYNSICTQNLNSSTVVTAVSPHFAILAHIAPRTEFTAGNDNCKAKIAEFLRLIDDAVKLFPPVDKAWIIRAYHMGKPALPEQCEIIKTSSMKMGWHIGLSGTMCWNHMSHEAPTRERSS